MHKGLTAARSYIGTSGWSYPHWKQKFYHDTAQKDWLRYCAERFTGIEINSSFYHLQRQEIFAGWGQQTPAAFRFSLKANRYLTHNKKLNDPDKSISLERERAKGLGNKLAVVLWQLPGQFQINLRRLETFSTALEQWKEARHCIEFRHPSWFTDDVADCLHKHRIAVCQSDAADWKLWDIVTTDFVYVRLHGHTITYESSYNLASLSKWVIKLQNWLNEGRDVHVYFDNDAKAAAPRNAMQLQEMLHQSRQQE